MYFPFANISKPEWPSFFSPAEDIMAYLEKVCKCFDLKKYMQFESKVLGAHWNEQAGKWTVQISQKQSDGSTSEFEDTCDLLLQCTGVLSFPKLPNIPGLENFKGKVSSNYQIAEGYLIED
jgi:cation diffusion facilitator CzcD-associated flavoprotein CzcO